MHLSRRHMIAATLAGTSLPHAALANTPTEVTWEDLLPPGVPYSQIISEGVMDEENDIWRPVFDENATKLNTALDGAYIKMPGFMIPIDLSTEGVRLGPACICRHRHQTSWCLSRRKHRGREPSSGKRSG